MLPSFTTIVAKRMSRTLEAGIDLFAILALLVSLYFGTGGRVVCLGADGHIAIEAANWTQDCAEPYASAAHSAYALSESHCGVCLDLVVTIDEATTRGGPGPAPLARSLMANRVPAWDAPAPLQPRNFPFSSFLKDPLPNLSTHKIVLII